MFKRSQLLAVATCILSAGALAFADGPAPIDAITHPSKDVIVSFVRPGRIVEMPVKEGDEVKEGQLVARQDDSEEVAQMLEHKMKSEDMVQVEVQQHIKDQADIDLDNMVKSKAGSLYEVDHARLQAKVEEARVKLASVQQDQEKFEYQASKAADEKTKIFSPITGHVEQTMIKVGESSDVQNMKAMRIVNNNPLWVEAAVPFDQGARLKNGDAAQINFPEGVRQGKVIHVGTVADSGSATLLVRVEVGNEQQTPAGGRVTMSFPTAAGVASADKP